MIVTPTNADNTWPRIEFRGWENGDSIVLNSRMAAAPKEPITRTSPGGWRTELDFMTPEMRIRAVKAPRKE